MPMYEPYEDNGGGGVPEEPGEEEDPVQVSTPIDEELTTDIDDIYFNTSIVLQQGNVFDHGRVIIRKRNIDGDPICSTHINLVLDTCQHLVEFGYSDDTKLTANVIAKLIYALVMIKAMNICCWMRV
eukprot:14740575-Ditylum_brightwellii.AAC.1